MFSFDIFRAKYQNTTSEMTEEEKEQKRKEYNER